MRGAGEEDECNEDEDVTSLKGSNRKAKQSIDCEEKQVTLNVLYNKE